MRVNARFLRSAVDAAHFPPVGPPEIAFLGRSNVGKSSLINSLLGEKMARTSSTPGRTRMINFFEVRRPGKPHAEWLFADLPGYGYAKLPREQTAEWPKFIEPYLQDRESLVLCIVLVDANIPPQTTDRQLVAWLNHQLRPFLLVATKSDRMSGNELAVALRRLGHEHGDIPVVAFSAKTGAGRDELWSWIQQSAEKHGTV